jgi:aminoglycoside phosphotransferase (APT) family kinase protein
MVIATADILTDESLVHRLLVSQHPDLAAERISFAGNGWDNDLYRVGDELVARLPRRKVAVTLLLQEQRWLPEIAARLSVAIPRPARPTARRETDCPAHPRERAHAADARRSPGRVRDRHGR